MQFALLDDSPMFRQQIQCLEENAEMLRGRCTKFYKGCRKYTEGLGEGFDNHIAFVNALEMFGGGHDDPLSVAFGGPVMAKFTIALREIGTYKEVLRAMVENILNEKLLHFISSDLLEVKEARKRFDKASHIYDQAREKFLSLKKSTRMDVACAIEEEMLAARSSFELARFALATALSNIEAKKRFEFLETVSGTMNAHLRFFKQAHEILHKMEPLINKALNYSRQTRESSNCEQISLNERMQQYIMQIDRGINPPLDGTLTSPAVDCRRPFPRSSQKVIDAVVESAAKGEVQTIRQGYLSKRSSNLRADWKRRFFVLDSRGMLYYYRKPLLATGNQSAIPKYSSCENGSGLLSLWLSSHSHGSASDDKAAARQTLNLLTSTIKVDAEQSDLRFCFRIISPTKTYTLQAQNALDQMDWIEKINGVIASLLSIHTSNDSLSLSPKGSGDYSTAVSENSSVADSSEANQSAVGDKDTSKGLPQQELGTKSEKTINVLMRVPGNDKCADCSAPEPDWASLNLGVLICIKCSGFHRNLGVHISKVRSLTLDVKAWEPSVVALFQSLGNTYANTVWEEVLHSRRTLSSEDIAGGSSNAERQKQLLTMKPTPDDPFSVRELFIHAKYAERAFVSKIKDDQQLLTAAQEMRESVCANDKKAVYRHIICSKANVNAATYSPAPASHSDSCENSSTDSQEQLVMHSTDGCSLLHLACITADVAMVELLLQYGANINAADYKGRTPLHYCIISSRTAIAKLLLRRGADVQNADNEGRTALHLALASGFNDDEVIVLLSG